MALNSNALVTLATTKGFLGISDASLDSEVERLINTASQSIERITSRILVNATHTEYHNGRRSNMIQTRQWPITGGPSTNSKPQIFFDDDGTGSFSGSEVDDSEYWVHEMQTQIIRRTGNWPKGYRNIKVVYTAGYGAGGDSASMPSDLENACLQFVAWEFRQNNDRRIGVDTKTKLGETVRYTQGVPQFIMELIHPFIRQEFSNTQVPVRNS